MAERVVTVEPVLGPGTVVLEVMAETVATVLIPMVPPAEVVVHPAAVAVVREAEAAMVLRMAVLAE